MTWQGPKTQDAGRRWQDLQKDNIALEKLARHLNGKCVVFEPERLDGFKPSFVTLGIDIVFDYRKTIRPQFLVVYYFLLFHLCHLSCVQSTSCGNSFDLST